MGSFVISVVEYIDLKNQPPTETLNTVLSIFIYGFRSKAGASNRTELVLLLKHPTLHIIIVLMVCLM